MVQKNQKMICMGVDLSYTAFWILAAPKRETYQNMTRPKAIETYKKMAWEDFDKQFKCDEEMQAKDERAIFLPHSEPSILKRTFITLDIVNEWKEKPAELQLTSLVYTTPDGYPCAEAVHVREFIPSRYKRIKDAERDLQKFYNDHKWRTNIRALRNLNPLETKKEEVKKLDDVVLPTIMQVFKYGRNR